MKPMDILSLLEQHCAHLKSMLERIENIEQQQEQLTEAYYQALQEKISFIAQLLPCLDRLNENSKNTATQLCLTLQKELQPAIEKLKIMHQETARQLQQLAPLAAHTVSVARFIDTQG